jgi:hypothetical protein
MLNKLFVFIIIFGATVLGSEKVNAANDHVIKIPIYGNNGTNRAILIKIQTSEFIASNHKIINTDDKFGLNIDGKPAIGLDGAKSVKSSKLETINSMRVGWNGKSIDIQSRLFDTIFNSELHGVNKDEKSPDSGINATESDDGTRLIIRMTSYRNAACGYTVYWIINSKGETFRFVELHDS